MKIHKLYCNKDDFQHIQFNLNGVSVIYADTKTQVSDKDNLHNLGKTILAKLIDFMLLKGIDSMKKHFFYKEKSSADKFKSYVFYLEILLNSNKFLTIRRAVSNNTKISFKVSLVSSNGFTPPDDWDEENLSLKKAIQKLQEYLNFDFFKTKNDNYRKGINYSLRRQGDYADIYMLNKFSRGQDRYWKPFMFDLLGFDGNLLLQKYEIDVKIEELKNFANNLRKEFDIDEAKRDELIGQIQIKKDDIQGATQQIDKFNFYKEDKKAIQKGVEGIETKISSLNTISYNLENDINQLNLSVKKNFSFDLTKIKKIFEDTKIFFPEQLSSSYQDLLSFNKSITTERNKHLKQTLKKKSDSLILIREELQELNKNKEELLSFIQDTSTFKRFKNYQKKLAHLESNLVSLEEKLAKVDLIISKDIENSTLKGDLDTVVGLIRKISITTEKNHLYKNIRNHFSRFYKDIIDENATISWTLNKQNNIDFNSPSIERTKDSLKVKTSQGDGYTFTKLFCVAFDLAILSSYSKESYFKFVYHDDVLANEDNGVKHRFMSMIERITSEYDFQYFFSVIKDDLPVDPITNQPLSFSKKQVVLNLHDKDESGTLFGFNF
jgi:uncharacterized protein YydD (DUF2326 family)